MKKPTTEDAYKQWARETLSVDFDDRLVEARHRANAAVVDDVVQASDWYRSAETAFAQMNEAYETKFAERLFMETPELRLNKKPFKSMVNKSYRMNVLDNIEFPNPPKGEWVTPDNWFSRMNDCVRTSLVCRFLDGPEYVCQQLQTHANTCGLSSHFSPRGRDEGYYSHHLYLSFTVNLLTTDGTADQPVEFEIQVTTQLQDILKNLTHRYYSQDRSSPRNSEWKWEFKTNRFRARFLSHSLHLLEALIVDVRDNEESE